MSQPKAKSAQKTRKQLIADNQKFFADNQALSQMVLKLRDELNKNNTEEYKQRKEFHYSIPDLRSRDELKAYMRDGFFGSNYNDRQKAFKTYQINFALSDADLYNDINEVEKEIQLQEDEKFLLERDFQVSKVREQEAEKIKLIEENQDE